MNALHRAMTLLSLTLLLGCSTSSQSISASETETERNETVTGVIVEKIEYNATMGYSTPTAYTFRLKTATGEEVAFSIFANTETVLSKKGDEVTVVAKNSTGEIKSFNLSSPVRLLNSDAGS